MGNGKIHYHFRWIPVTLFILFKDEYHAGTYPGFPWERNPKGEFAIGGSRGGRARHVPPHLPGILVFETYFFQFHALFT